MFAKMDAESKKIEQKVIHAAEEEGKVEFEEMRRRVPVDTGELRDSGGFNVEKKGNHILMNYHFDADHAVVVHEDMEAFHADGQAKYLESVLLESAPHILKRIKERAG